MAVAFVPGPCVDGLRARDLTSVAGWLEFRQPRRAKAILVTGRAGFGKSLLASQALDLAQRLGCTSEWTPLPTSIKSAPKCYRSVCAHQGARDCDMPH